MLQYIYRTRKSKPRPLRFVSYTVHLNLVIHTFLHFIRITKQTQISSIFFCFSVSDSTSNSVPVDPPMPPMKRRDFTLEELKPYDGNGPGKLT